MFGLNFLSSISGTTTHKVPLFNLPLFFDFLVVASGGSVGGANNGVYYSGAGGAGGMICSGQTYQGGGGAAQKSLVLTAGASLVCTVGAETVATPSSYQGTTGNNSSLVGSGYNFVALGGGAGGNAAVPYSAGGAGGSGGGGAGGASGNPYHLGGAGTVNQGYAGGNAQITVNAAGGGGGGAGGVGGNAGGGTGGNAGLGLAWIDGKVYAYGGAGTFAGDPPHAAGQPAANRPAGGAPNRGSGSGAQPIGLDAAVSPNGGAGVIVICYPINTRICTGGTITQSQGLTFHTFTSSGTFAVTRASVR